MSENEVISEIRVAIRPEQAAIITRDHQQMRATVQQAQNSFLRSLELLSAGQAPQGAAFVGIETDKDGGPVLVFDAAPAA